MSEAPQDPEIDHQILFDIDGGPKVKAESTRNPEAKYSVITYKTDEFGNEICDVIPDANLEIDTTKNTSNFVIHILEKTKESARQHPKATAFTVSTVVTGIATGIMVIRRHRHK